MNSEDLLDKIDGLESDLQSAVEVAFRHGAREWVRLNYPREYGNLLQKEATELEALGPDGRHNKAIGRLFPELAHAVLENKIELQVLTESLLSCTALFSFPAHPKGREALLRMMCDRAVARSYEQSAPSSGLNS